MDEENLVLQLIVSVIDLYDDYSHLKYERLRKVIYAKLKVIRYNFQSLLKIPSSEKIEQGELCIESSKIKASFQYLQHVNGQSLKTVEEVIQNPESSYKKSPDFRVIRSIILQIIEKSTDNQLVTIVCNCLLQFLELYEKKTLDVEDDLVCVLHDCFIHEYIFHKKLNTELDIDASAVLTSTFPIPSHIDALAFHSDNQVLQKTYDSMLLQAISPPSLPIENRSQFIEDRILKISRIASSVFKNVSQIYCFYDLSTSIDLNNGFIRVVEVLCVEESKDLANLVEEYFNKYPILPELMLLVKDLKVLKSVKSDKVDTHEKGYETPQTLKEINGLLLQITSSFKRYELYERESEEPGLEKLSDTYYEFKFLDVFKTYITLVQESEMIKNIGDDPFFRLVKFEVLKYRGQAIVADCWDISLHNLCKIMFSAGGEYANLQTTVYHRLAVFCFAQSQASKRKLLLQWQAMTVLKDEERFLLHLFEKTVKKRVMSKWVSRFVKIRTLEVQADKYKQACNRNLIFSKWLNSYETQKDLNQLSTNFTQGKFMAQWYKKASNKGLYDKYEHFMQLKKSKFFHKVIDNYKMLKSLEAKSNAFSMNKFVRKIVSRNERFRDLEKVLLKKRREKYFKSWKSTFLLTGTKELVQLKNNQHLMRWAFNNWSQRAQEHGLCMQFRAIRDQGTLKNNLYSMLLIKENNELAREFARRTLLTRYMERFRYSINLKSLKRISDEITLKQYFKKWKVETRYSLMRESNEYKIRKSVFKTWNRKLENIKNEKFRKLEELEKIATDRFKASERALYLRYFTYKWEEATIRVLEKQDELQDVYDNVVLERYTGPFFQNWMSNLLKITSMNAKAASFEKNVTCLNYLGIMLDAFQDVQYLEELSDELLQMSDLRLLSQVFKNWSLKSLKIRSTKNLVVEFQKRSEASVLRNFLYLWKATVSERLEDPDESALGDESGNYSSLLYSPLLHRYPRKFSSSLSLRQFANPASSTPLKGNIGADQSFVSPRRRDTSLKKLFKTPLNTRSPVKITTLNSSTLNSENFRRSQLQELKNRYQGLKLSPSGDRSSNSSSFSNYVTATRLSPPPAQPSFVDAVKGDRILVHNVEIDFEENPSSTNDIFGANEPRSSKIRSLIDDDIASPKVSPVAVLRERMNRNPSRFFDRDASLEDDFHHTRSSSLTFVDQSVDDRDDFFENNSLDNVIPPPTFRRSFRDLRGRTRYASNKLNTDV